MRNLHRTWDFSGACILELQHYLEGVEKPQVAVLKDYPVSEMAQSALMGNSVISYQPFSNDSLGARMHLRVHYLAH
jgi:hypothetical protein